jgi:hypothetical protein
MHPLTPEQEKLLEEYRKSGMKKKVFCQRSGIALNKLDYLIYKQQKLSRTETTFFKVTERNSNGSITIDLKELTLTITNDVNDELLRKIIKAARL